MPRRAAAHARRRRRPEPTAAAQPGTVGSALPLPCALLTSFAFLNTRLQEDDEEARLEALEARVRGVGAARRQPEAPPTINIRGQQPKKQPVTPLAERIKGKDGA